MRQIRLTHMEMSALLRAARQSGKYCTIACIIRTRHSGDARKAFFCFLEPHFRLAWAMKPKTSGWLKGFFRFLYSSFSEISISNAERMPDTTIDVEWKLTKRLSRSASSTSSFTISAAVSSQILNLRKKTHEFYRWITLKNTPLQFCMKKERA